MVADANPNYGLEPCRIDDNTGQEGRNEPCDTDVFSSLAAPGFFTVVTERRRPILASPDAVGVLREAFRTVRKK